MQFAPEILSSLDFSPSTGLQHLGIGSTVRFGLAGRFGRRTAVKGDSVTVHPDLGTLLAHITPHCRLRTLSLTAEIDDPLAETPPWTLTLAHLAELLDASGFASLLELQVIVEGSRYLLYGLAHEAREQLEPIFLAAIPSSATYRVLCVDGKDEEIGG